MRTPTVDLEGTWWGWDPESIDVPPLLPELPWHDNTGLWRVEDREALRRWEGDFVTSRDGQVIDRVLVTGKVIVRHEDVVIKRSWLQGTVVNETKSETGAPLVIHCDMGHGEAGDFKRNGTKAAVHVYRSNLFGLTDGAQTTPARGPVVFQNNFVHDLRYATDPTVNSGGGHNDGFKTDSKFDVEVDVIGNTFWSWTINNMTEKETATRSSGPNWTDNGDPLTSTGNTARDGTPANGLQNAGVMIAPEPVTIRVKGNLFRGHTYYQLNVQTDGFVEVTDNLFAVDEHVPDRAVVSGWSNIDVWERNADYATGEVIPARN
jgi:hypothetical protein